MTAIYIRVASMVRLLIEADVEALEPYFPDLTPKQIGSALINAKYFGLVVVAKNRSRGRHKGRAPAIWKSAPAKPKPAPRVNSVFALGAQ